jgi:hypothetical protein
MYEITCQKCGYVWNTKSKERRISCSRCKTSITIDFELPANHPGIPGAIPRFVRKSNKHPIENEVKFPKTLWKDVRLSQRFMALDNMGETYLTLKVNSEGILSL